MTGGEQQNPAPRHRVTVFIGEGEEMEPFGRTRDLSVSGVFLETDERPAIGTHREISVVWGDDTLVCSAEVVRHGDDGIGMTFIAPSQHFIDVVADIIAGMPRVGGASREA